jgi:succinate-acetate transporter protein
MKRIFKFWFFFLIAAFVVACAETFIEIHYKTKIPGYITIILGGICWVIILVYDHKNHVKS